MPEDWPEVPLIGMCASLVCATLSYPRQITSLPLLIRAVNGISLGPLSWTETQVMLRRASCSSVDGEVRRGL